MSNLQAFQSFAPKDTSVKVSGNNAVIYTRVSHHSQEDNTSLESQEKFCRDFADKKNLNVIALFGGTHESAKTDDRKEFKRMLKYIKQSKTVSQIVVYSYERFSRSGVGGAKIADDLLKDYGVVTLAVTQELDPTTSSGSFQQKILFLFGQMDNEMRRDKTVTGMTELLIKGYTPYSIPRGYVNLNKGKAVNQNIVMNEEGKLIQKAFMWKAKQQLGNAEIVRRLKRLDMVIDLRRLASIFQNPYYCGLIVSRMVPDQVIEGRHESIVSQSVFLKVNDIVQERRVAHPKAHRLVNDHLPLKKFMRCGDCNTPMTGYLVKAKGLYYYKCRTKGCKHSASAKKTHGEFETLLSMFELDKRDVPLVELAMTTFFEEYFKEQEENSSLTNQKIKSLQKQVQQIKERFVLGKIDNELYQEFFNKYNSELCELQSKMTNTPATSSNLQNALQNALDFCLNPKQWWSSLPIDKQLQLQNLLFPKGVSLCKQNKRVLTDCINFIFAPIAEIAKVLRENKKGQPISFDQLSSCVTPTGFKPVTLRAEI